MKKQDAGILLKQLIVLKEAEHVLEGKLLKEQLHLIYESLNPINIMKNAFKGIFSVSDFKTNMVNSAIGLTTGFVAKKVFIAKSHNSFTKLAGIILEIVVASAVTKNSETVKSIGGFIFKNIFRKKEEDAEKST